MSLISKVQNSLKNHLPLATMILALFALRSSIVEPYVVPTGSMEPTLKTGDRLYALKCAYDLKIPFTNRTLFHFSEVKRGDVILFQAPHNPQMTYVKRAIGLPGDRLEIQDGVLYINGKEILKTELSDREILYDIDRKEDKTLFVENLTGKKHYVILDQLMENHPSRNLESITVPEGHLFAVGDNRDNSFDSRAWGFVPYDNLKGKALFIWFSGWDPLLKESMVKEHGLVMQIAYFFIDFFRFTWDWLGGKAWIRYEKIGTLIQ